MEPCPAQVQWQPGQWCDFLVSFFEQDPPVAYPPYGRLQLLAKRGMLFILFKPEQLPL